MKRHGGRAVVCVAVACGALLASAGAGDRRQVHLLVVGEEAQRSMILEVLAPLKVEIYDLDAARVVPAADRTQGVDARRAFDAIYETCLLIRKQGYDVRALKVSVVGVRAAILVSAADESALAALRDAIERVQGITVRHVMPGATQLTSDGRFQHAFELEMAPVAWSDELLEALAQGALEGAIVRAVHAAQGELVSSAAQRDREVASDVVALRHNLVIRMAGGEAGGLLRALDEVRGVRVIGFSWTERTDRANPPLVVEVAVHARRDG